MHQKLAEQMASEVRAAREELITHRRYLHQHPETGFDTKNTERYVRDFLTSQRIELLPSSVGVLGIIRGGAAKPEKTGAEAEVKREIVGLRADMDALNLTEMNDVSYRSVVDGKMHACGHDGHTAMLMTAARILKDHEAELPNDVLLLFQPAEEGPDLGGAVIMVADLEQLEIAERIRAFGGIHLSTQFPVGTVVVKYGSAMASTDVIRLKIVGKGGHAGMPHTTVDALSIAAKFVTEMESFMSRRVDPFDPAVFSIGMLHAGSAVNIVAGTAEIGATLRCQSEENRSYILQSVEQIVKGICTLSGAEYELEIQHGLPNLVNDEDTTKRAEEIAALIVGREQIIHKKNPDMGAEDYAFIAKRFPSAFLWLGARNEEKGLIHLMHNSGFDFDEDALMTGALLHCRMAVEL